MMSDMKNPVVTITMADGRVMKAELYPDTVSYTHLTLPTIRLV